jgi:lysophospholipase L1-like esterase
MKLLDRVRDTAYTPRSRRRASVAAFGLAAVVLGACSSAPAPSGQTHTGGYVALGDSFTANSYHGPSASGNGCDQSGRNQPHVVQARMGYATFVDASCDGATTNDILNNGNGDQAQIAFVNSSTRLVTLSIGGNDIGFSDIVKNCTLDYLTFGGCKADYVSGTTDEISNRIAATAPKVAQVLATVQSRAPQAQIFVYGYPTLVPMSGTSSCTGLTLSSGDIPYLRSKQAELETMLRAKAQAAGARFIDVYGPSAGHDPCASSAWVARVIDLPPVHPTGAGVDALASIVANAVDANLP